MWWVMQEGGTNPKPVQRFQKESFLRWVAKLKQEGAEVHAVYEACGFGFGLQRQLTALGIQCQVVCPQKLDEGNKRVKTDGLRPVSNLKKVTSLFDARLGARPRSFSAVIALIILSRPLTGRIGVGAVGKQNTNAPKEEEAFRKFNV